MPPPLVSVIVVVHDRAVLVDAMLASVVAQTEERFEVLVMLEDATPDARRVVERYANADARIVPTACPPGTTPSTARNLGVDRARGDILYFLDDDTVVPPAGLATLLEVFRTRPEVDIVGGPNLTPPDDPELGQITGCILASPLGTGVARARYAKVPQRRARERHLILCNLAVHRRTFDAGIRFPVLFGGEENTLMGHADEGGFRLWYSPDVWVYHHRRTTIAGYVEQLVRYGRGRALALRHAPHTFHVAYLLPVGLVVYTSVALPASIVAPISLAPLAVYGAAVTAASIVIVVRERKPRWLPLLPPLFALTHLAYGFGLARALLAPPRTTSRHAHPSTEDGADTSASSRPSETPEPAR